MATESKIKYPVRTWKNDDPYIIDDSNGLSVLYLYALHDDPTIPGGDHYEAITGRRDEVIHRLNAHDRLSTGYDALKELRAAMDGVDVNIGGGKEGTDRFFEALAVVDALFNPKEDEGE